LLLLLFVVVAVLALISFEFSSTETRPVMQPPILWMRARSL
jgi:hypothetical protein